MNRQRREFLQQATAWAAAHTCFSGAVIPRQENLKIDVQPRFRKLRLQTNRLQETKSFYQQSLNCPVVGESANSLVVGFGATEIEFAEAAGDLPRVVYHFAFNIPENKIQAAVDWMATRAPLINHLQTGKPIVHFEWLNAHSIYFWDPSGNLVEFIAHHRLNNSGQGKFGPDDILCASEIGLVVDDVAATNRELKSLLDVDCYADAQTRESRCNNDSFRAVGDPNGFFIVVRRQRTWLMTDIPATTNPVEVAMIGRDGSRISLQTAACMITQS